MNATKRSHRGGLYQKILSLMITVAMIIGCMPISNVFAKNGSDWVLSEDGSTATMQLSGGVVTYRDAKTAGSVKIDAKDGSIQGSNSGKVKKDTGLLYQFDQGSFCSFVPSQTGTLTMKISNATTDPTNEKAFGVNKLETASVPEALAEISPTADDVVGYFISGAFDGNTNSDPGVLEVKQTGENYAGGSSDLKIKVDELGYTYFFAVGGSKIKIFDIDYIPDGGVVEPPVENTTENTENPGEETTDKTEPPAEETTDKTENPGEETTEAPAVSNLPLGAFTGGEVVVINDAVQVLEYVKDRGTFTGTKAMLDAGEVSGDKRITAEDAAQIVAKVKDENFKFTRTDYNPGKPNPPATEGTTEKPDEGTTEETPVTPGGTPTLWVLGDSTVCNYTAENVESINWRNGWGMALDQYLDTSKIKIENIALSGRSTRDFRTKPEYKQFTDGIKAGDYVLIQFGHNDEKEPLKADNSINGSYGKSDADGGISTAAGLEGWKDSTDGYVAVAGLPEVPNSCIVDGKLPSFEAILYKDYVNFAIEKKANPILVTPIARATGAGDNEFKGYEVKSDGTIDSKEQTLRTNYAGASNGGHTAVTWKNTTGMKDKTMNYVQGIKDVAAYAKEQTGKDVPVVTLDELSVTAFNAYGEAHGGSINDLMAHNTSNYVKGSDGVYTAKKYTSDKADATKLIEGPFKDGTHLSREGAKLAAGIVIEEIGKTNSGLKGYFKTGSENPGGETTESSSEDTTENSSEDTTESSSEDTTESVPPAAEVSINDVDSFDGYGLVQNQGKAVINLKHEEDVNGNNTAKIHIGDKAVLKQFDAPATSGKYQFSVDFLSNYADTNSAGRTFRIYFENLKSTLGEKDTNSADNFTNDEKAAGYITESNLVGTGIFYQMTNVGKTAYVVEADTPSYNATDEKAVGEIAESKWYHMVIDLDLDAKTAVTKIYSHGDSWAPDTDWAAATPIGTVTSNFVADKTPSLAQVRLVKTAAGNIYFDNIKLAKAE